MSADTPPSLYRIIKGAAAQESDFQSAMALARAPIRPPERAQPELWTGLSMFEDAEMARRRVKRFPRLGTFLARVQGSDPDWSTSRPTGDDGHHTVWGRPEIFLAAIKEIIPV